jgi:crotonobetainyl-CoA:carnitine CoA-transferase CaiB-like acyl-CoA transferase
MGDHATGANMAGGIAAALLARERGLTRGQFVSTSLTRTAAYQLGQDMNQAIRTGVTPRMVPREDQRNPLMNAYKTKDARWIWLLMLESDRFWERFVHVIAAPELAKDDRFQSSLKRAANCSTLTALLDGILARQTFSYWTNEFDADDIWWAPVQEIDDVLRDSAFFDAGCIVAVPDGSGGTVDMVASPIDFSVSSWAPETPAPQLGAHTELILTDDLGVNWETIAELKTKGVIL